MASIQSLGIGSGLLTSELVDDIIAAEREATDLRIDAKRAEYDARISAFGSVKSSLSVLRTSADALSRSSSLLSKVATSSNEQAVTATATAAAESGVHSVEVLSLARSHTLASIEFDDIDSVVGDGTLDFRFGTTTFSGGNYDSFTENAERAGASITIDSSNNTVTGIRDTINAAGIGVTASIVNDGSGYVLVLTSDDSGEDNGMEITVSEGATPGLSALAFNAAASTAGVNMTQTVAADDATLNVDGIVITRETNTITEVVAGVTFNARSLNPGAPATISVTQDTAGIADKVQAFVDAYNSAKALTDQLTDFDEDSETGALLIGDSTIRGIRSQMRRLLGRSVVDLQSTTIRSLVDLGISTDQNAGFQLRFDSQKLLEALTSNPDDVAALLADQKRAADNLIKFVSFQPGTEAGSYDVEITQLATQGQLLGQSKPSLNGNIAIDADNDELAVVVDGVTSNTITLSQGSYKAEQLAEELQTRINADSKLAGAGATVSVVYNPVERRFEFASASYGSSSRVGIDSLDTNTTADLGLVVDSGDSGKGLDVAGTVNGIAGTGAGQFLSIPSGPIPATSGEYRSASVSGFDAPPLTLDASNNGFTLSVDGITSNGILLTEQDYGSGAELAAEMQTRINADAALAAAGKSVTVEYDAVSKTFLISSASTGNASTVNMVSVSAGAQAALGFSVGLGEPGKVASKAANEAGGIQIQVLGGTTGARGTVTLVRGVMNRFDRYLDTVLNFGGTLDNKLSSLDERMSDLDNESTEFNKRMDLLEDRLRLQFAAADALISELNSTATFLDQQLSTLPGYTRKDQ